MLASFTNGNEGVKLLGMMIVGLLLLGLIYRAVRREQVSLEGELVYDIGRSLLKRSVPFDPVKEIVMSIGPEVLSDYHIPLKSGISFRFTVQAVKSNSGERMLSIRCEPPGVLEHNGEIKSEIEIYNGGKFNMNGVPIQYYSGNQFGTGKNILEERTEHGEIN